ncbi:MAG: lipocalin family protein [Thiohalocapsa sp.]|jgi:apolipoprotein D and lipocalin family protein
MLDTLAKLAALMLGAALSTGCVETGGEPMETVPYVDLDRFMGDWYVVANIPTPLEQGAHNPLESYALSPDGTVATTFTFNKGSFDGPKKTYRPKGFVLDKETNARWGMQFVWPVKADYRIIYLDEAYEHTVIGRAKRDYVWVMARSPTLDDKKLAEIEAFLDSVGYDIAKLERPPHRSPSAESG